MFEVGFVPGEGHRKETKIWNISTTVLTNPYLQEVHKFLFHHQIKYTGSHYNQLSEKIQMSSHT